ncbi:MFS transporter [Rhizobium sp. NXC14]|uniref:MFS transporter n=1 Tax=Rhizobium sp. NXC14 TaxID=1981173 RepID=UPI002478ED72|nr:MFS transporter [Rhizobium sp. NXC14]
MPALDLKPRSGPILVTTEYAISEENAALFLEIMCRRRHAQSRVGARQWTLTRDVQQPSRWLETFRTPTWTDFHRLHHRLTAADKRLDDALKELSAVSNLPRKTILVERPTVARKSPPVPYVSQK